MQEVLIFATIISPVILGLVEVYKRIPPVLSTEYLPVVSILIGLLVGFAAQPFTELDIFLRLWAGGLAGLSATGLFELVKPVKGGGK